MDGLESQPSFSFTFYGFLFLLSIGLPIFLISWLVDSSYSIPPVNGWGLVCFYMTMGFLSVGLFGLLALLSHYALRSPSFAKEWQFGFGSLLMAGITFFIFMAMLDASGLDFWGR